jgi:hypothetical protein
MYRSRRQVSAAATALIALWIGAPPAHAQAVRVVAPQRVTVKAEATPLGDLLNALNTIAPVPSLNLDPSESTIPISIAVENVSPLDAMWLVLKESKLDFVMSSKGIWAGRAKKAAERGEPIAAAKTAPVAEREIPIAEDRRAAEEPRDDRKPSTPSGVVPVAPPTVAAAPTSDAALDMAAVAVEDGRDEFGRGDTVRIVPYTIRGDSVRVELPGFVPYKLQPEVVKRRLSTDVTIIP